MSYETLIYGAEEAIATITLNRPERLNTIVPPMPEEIEAAVHRAIADPAAPSAPASTSAAAFTTGTRR